MFKADKARGKKFQGIEYNIKKFGSMAQQDVQEAVADLIKIKNNKSVFEGFLTKKFAAATIIPTIIMGFILPPLNFALTKNYAVKIILSKMFSLRIPMQDQR